MANKLQIGIIGLGKFGFPLGQKLSELGHEIVGVDLNESLVTRAQPVFTQVYTADAIDKAALEQLGFGDLPYVVVCVGQELDSSILIALHLKELGTKKVLVKAMSEDHEKILMKLGVDRAIFPEKVAAEQLAHRLDKPGFLEMLPFWKGIVLQEITISNWNGKILRDLDMINEYNTQVVAIRRAGDSKFHFVPHADQVLHTNDKLVVIGNEEDIKQIKP